MWKLVEILALGVLTTCGLIGCNPAVKDEVKDYEKELPKSEEITIVPTMKDEITADAAWCGTFQLVWNDMKNEVVKTDIVFTPQEKMAENLNLEEFTTEMISEEYYFKKYGLKTLQLKEEIEEGIKEKFDQTSDILDKFDWSEDGLHDPNQDRVLRYFFYVMLYRKFEFLNQFDVLENATFADIYEDVEYFGINNASKAELDEQIRVLYYNSKDDFAISLSTKDGDEVILCKSPSGNTFEEIYNNMNEKTNNYDGQRAFNKIDVFKMPKLEIDVEREYVELQNKKFMIADPLYDNATGEIYKAIQTIKFTIDEKGGEIKSEAGIDMKVDATSMPIEIEEPRQFYVDNTFAIFLKESGREKPYFAARVDDITKF